MKQRAVDYLVKELSAILGHLETKPIQDLLMVDAINKAKQIEKQQIIDAYTHERVLLQITAEQYYNETYKNQ
jgi:hypothetical protein